MQRHAYVDALRGYAILGVVMVHASQQFPALEWPFRPLANHGARGVQLFFVASAFTLMLSWHRRDDGAASFFIRRFFRIAPMFWLAIIFFVLLDGFAPRYWAPNGIGWPHVLATAAFIHGWQPETINSVVPGGWSIAVEMTFYLLFPLLAVSLRSWWSATLALIFSMITARLAKPLATSWWPDQERYLVDAFAYLWFPNQLLAFFVGILVFHLSRDLTERIPRIALEAGTIIWVVLILQSPFLLRFNGSYELFFGGVTFCLAQGAGTWLVTRPIRWLGMISYSAYLWHFAILGGLGALGLNSLGIASPAAGWPYFLFFFAVLLAMTVGLSAVTYHYVEARGIGLGQNLAAKFNGRATNIKDA